MKLNQDQVLELLRREIDKAGSQKQWAADHGISEAYLSDVLNKHRGLGASILEALGFYEIPMYEKTGGNREA